MTDTDTTDDATTTDTTSAPDSASLLDAASRHQSDSTDDNGQGKSSDDSTDTAGANGKDTTADVAATQDPDSVTATFKKSDIPDNFIKNGEFAADSLIKAWKDANDEVRQLRKSKAATDAPDKPDGYDYALTEDQQQMAAKVLRPGEDGSEDPVLANFRQFAHEESMSKDLYGKLVRWYIETTAPLIPDPVDQKAELGKLGTHAQKIIDATDSFGETMKANGLFDEAMAQEFRLTCSSAAGIKMINAIRDHYGESPIPVQLHRQAAQTDSAADLDAKVGDIAKRRAAGEITEEQADRELAAAMEGYEEIYGTEPTGRSIVRQ